MKKTLYLLPTFLLLHMLVSAQSVDLNEGLIAHYLFNGSAKDASRFANHGKKVGGIQDVEDRFGNACGAYQFNGIDAYVTAPDSKSLSSPTNAFTVSVWLKLHQGTPFSDLQWMTIVCKSNQSKETKSNPHFRVQSTKVTLSINTEFTENTKHFLDFDRWFHYTVVYNGKKVKAYLDGIKITEFAYRGALIPNTQPLEIGRDLPGDREFYGGSMDDLRIYNRALSLQEIQIAYKDDAERTSPKPCTEPKECNIISFRAMPGKCNPSTGTYDLTVQTQYENPPKKGKLILSAAGKQSKIKFDPKGTTETSTLLGLPANGERVDISAYFTSDEACAKIFPRAFLAPTCEAAPPVPEITSNCSISAIEAKPTKCRTVGDDSVYDLEVDVRYEHAPNSGQLLVEAAGIQKIIDFDNKQSSRKLFLRQLPANGKTVNVLTYFTAENECVKISPNTYTAPTPCKETIAVGTVDVQERITVKSEDITLLFYDNQKEDGDTVSIRWDGDWIINKLGLRLKKNGPKKINLKLEPNRTYELVSKAWNLGEQPPNTMTIEIIEPNVTKNRLIKVNSFIGKSGAILVTYEE